MSPDTYIIDWDFFTSLWETLTKVFVQAPRLVSQSLGALTSIGASWGSVNYIGSIIGTMVLSIAFFLVFDIVRDLL